MTLTEFYNEVSRKADTDPGTQINVAETKRVLSEAFLLMSEMETADAIGVLVAGMKRAKSKTK